jgi:hypothetical protein
MSLLLIGLLLPALVAGPAWAVASTPLPERAGTPAAPKEGSVFLPVVLSLAGRSFATPRVNVPYFSGEIKRAETAITWFGQVRQAENYTDVRVGYNSGQLLVDLGVFDRLVWYDTHPAPQDLESWDAATIYLDTAGNSGGSPRESAYRFTGQLNWWEDRQAYQAAYRGGELGWVPFAGPFSTHTSYRGDEPNNDDPDRGWRITFSIPFSSLGLSGPPPEGTVWGFAIRLFDRDDAAGTLILPVTWPNGANLGRSASWAELSFGLPVFSPADIDPDGSVIIRQGLAGARVVDAQVGGSTTCGRGLEVFTEWGEANYAGYDKINIQNQIDIADWPCFSKFYITFPLDQVPAGKVILSAKLTLFQFGNSGEDLGSGPESLIQVLTVAEDWDEKTINWNNAPQPVENMSRSLVGWLPDGVPWPGMARSWDVGLAAEQAYAAGRPLRLVLYSADTDYHSGKYFITSDIADWSEAERPALQIVWGDP